MEGKPSGKSWKCKVRGRLDDGAGNAHAVLLYPKVGALSHEIS